MLFISLTLFSCKKSAEYFLESGNEKYNLYDYKGAIEDYSLAIEGDSNLAIAYNNRGLAKINLNRSIPNYPPKDKDSIKKSILSDYNMAIKLSPKMFEVYNNKAVALISLRCENGNPKYNKDVIVNLNKAIALNPKYSLAYYNRAVAKRNSSFIGAEYQDIMDDCTKAIDLNPNFAPSYIARAEIKEILNDFKGVLEDYSTAIKLCPKNSKYDLYYFRGSTKYSLKDFNGAIEDFNSALLYARNTKDSLYALKLRLYANCRIDPNSDNSKKQSLFLTKFEHSKSYKLLFKK